MKNLYLKTAYWVLFSIHFLLLHYLGISTFITTMLFYRLVYWLFQQLSVLTRKQSLRDAVLFNIKFILIIFLVFDFSCTFIFKKLNNYTENEKGIYLSLYKKQEQIKFLYNIGYLKNDRNVSQLGYDKFFKKRHKSKDFNYEITYNEVGFRGKFPGIKKDSNEFRILTIGDSFVEGYGTSEDSTFPKLLEDKLHLLNNNITVLNGGICGSNPLDEFKLYDKRLKIYNPDLVILELNNADLNDYRFANCNGKLPLYEYFYAISHLYRILFELVHNNLIINLFENKTSNQTILKPSKDLNLLIDKLFLFNKKLNNINTQFLIVYLPSKYELYSEKITYLKTSLIKNNIPFVDLQKSYQKKITNDLDSIHTYYWKNDGHHTPKGYDLMAKTIAEVIEKDYLTDKK